MQRQREPSFFLARVTREMLSGIYATLVEGVIYQYEDLITVMNGDALDREVLWFSAIYVEGVLDDPRPSDFLTCPGEDCGEPLFWSFNNDYP